jgi:hypothetical protein
MNTRSARFHYQMVPHEWDLGRVLFQYPLELWMCNLASLVWWCHVVLVRCIPAGSGGNEDAHRLQQRLSNGRPDCEVKGGLTKD